MEANEEEEEEEEEELSVEGEGPVSPLTSLVGQNVVICCRRQDLGGQVLVVYWFWYM